MPFWKSTFTISLTAKDVMRSEVTLAPRMARNATRSMATEAIMATRYAEDDGGRHGHGREKRQPDGIAGDGHHLAMREVDEPHDREDDGEAKCEQRIDAAEADGIHALLEEHIHDDHAARYASDILSLAASSRPVPAIAIRPFASTKP